MYLSYPLLISYAVQIALIVHCIRTGRDTIWIWVLMFLPVAGPVAYLIIEVIPGLTRSRSTQRAVKSVKRALDPQQDLRRLELEAKRSGGVAARQKYAEELVRQGRPQDAIAVYRDTLTGLYANDADLLLGLATAQFEARQFADAEATLRTLRQEKPDERANDARLLLARTLEAQGRPDAALSEYASLVQTYAGAEVPVRYAQLLRSSGRVAEARAVLTDLLEHARAAPAHYRRMQQAWLSSAEKELAGLR